MKFLVGFIGLIIGYFLNNYTLSVDEDENANWIKPLFDKNVTPIILLWDALFPAVIYDVCGGFTGIFFRFAILSVLLSAIIFIDFKHHIIPNTLNLIGFIAGAIILAIDRTYWVDYLTGLGIGVGFFLVLILVSKLILKKDGMGLGDAKLMAVIGLMFGAVYTIMIILLSFILGSVGALVVLIAKKKVFGEEIAFGPYIALAAMTIMFYGNDILFWYFG